MCEFPNTWKNFQDLSNLISNSLIRKHFFCGLSSFFLFVLFYGSACILLFTVLRHVHSNVRSYVVVIVFS